MLIQSNNFIVFVAAVILKTYNCVKGNEIESIAAEWFGIAKQRSERKKKQRDSEIDVAVE